MDAADGAELAELRRRAYGPFPDIAGDEHALARLIALEALARADDAAPPPGRAAQARAEEGPAEQQPAALQSAGTADGGDVGGARHPSPLPITRRRRPARGLLIGGAVAAAVAIAAWAGVAITPEGGIESGAGSSPADAYIDRKEAQSFAEDESAIVLLRIPLDGSFGNYIDLPTDEPVPEFPLSGETDWVAPLGEYYGWDLWIAAGTDALQRVHCVLIERGVASRSRCVPAALRTSGVLLVSVPYALIAPDERPPGMLDGYRLGFWWRDDGEVTVLMGFEAD
jgi:hypothetical protein